VLSTDPPVDRRDGDVAPKRFDRRNTRLRGDAWSLETATSDSSRSRCSAFSTHVASSEASSAAN